MKYIILFKINYYLIKDPPDPSKNQIIVEVILLGKYVSSNSGGGSNPSSLKLTGH